jgi:preprotein translocase subunit SecE
MKPSRKPWKAPDHRGREQERVMAKLSPGEFINQVRAEARKVIWPTRAETTSTAIFVGIMMLILAVFFLGIDALFSTIVRLLLSLA